MVLNRENENWSMEPMIIEVIMNSMKGVKKWNSSENKE